MFISLIYQILWIIFLLFIIFNTDVVYNYAKLFRLKFMKIKEFESYKKDNPKCDYFNFLRIYHSSFFVNLFTCKNCILFWICLISCLLFSTTYQLPTVYLISHTVYKLMVKYVW